MTCDQCGTPFDEGGDTDGMISICPICASYQGLGGEDYSYRNQISSRRRRRKEREDDF